MPSKALILGRKPLILGSKPLTLGSVFAEGWSTLHSIVPTNQSEFLGDPLTVKTHLRPYPL